MHQCCDHALYERDTLCTRPAPPPPVVGYESICKNRFCKATVEESSSQDKIQSQASPPNPSPKPSPASPAQRPAASARFKVRFQKKETRSTLTLQKEGTKIYATVGRVWTRRIMRPPRSPPQSAANPRPKMDLQERRKKHRDVPCKKCKPGRPSPSLLVAAAPAPSPSSASSPAPAPAFLVASAAPSQPHSPAHSPPTQPRSQQPTPRFKVVPRKKAFRSKLFGTQTLGNFYKP